MPERGKNILKYNHREKSRKVLFVIYKDTEFLFEKIDTCHRNPKKWVTTKVNKHSACVYSLFTHCSFDTT